MNARQAYTVAYRAIRQNRSAERLPIGPVLPDCIWESAMLSYRSNLWDTTEDFAESRQRLIREFRFLKRLWPGKPVTNFAFRCNLMFLYTTRINRQ